MGSPLTWLTLSLSHLAIADAAGLTGRAVFKGDDALVAAPRGDVEEYLSLMELAGYVVNRSKTFESQRSGIFCEMMFSKGRSPPPIIPLKRLTPITPVRLPRLARQIEKMRKGFRRSVVELVYEEAGRSGLIKDARRLHIPLSLLVTDWRGC
jgi:hypothetical protein